MVDKIRELCKKNGTSIFKLEKQLGFGNGVIGRWDKAVPNYERLSAVASALGVTVAELTGEADEKGIKKQPAANSDEPDKKALLDIVKSSDDEAFLLSVLQEVSKKLQEKHHGD